MGRNNKPDLQYFQMDVGILRDTKVRRLARKFDRGVEFYLYILCAIYSDKGYYMAIDDRTAFDIADDMRIDEQEAREMLEFCTSDLVGLFSRKLMNEHSILTSRGVQTRYVEVVKQLKRKVHILDKYSLLTQEEQDANVVFLPINSEEMPISSDVKGICSEEMGVNSEEMPIFSEQMAVLPPNNGISSSNRVISSDKSKVEESKVKENKIEEISLSEKKREEREKFLEILVFEKNLCDPITELNRFRSHYEKTDWLDANGNKIANKVAALKGWTPSKEAAKHPTAVVDFWRELYDTTGEAIGRIEMLEQFRGLIFEGDGVYITVGDRALVDSLERPDVAHKRMGIFNKHFSNRKLHYRCPKGS